MLWTPTTRYFQDQWLCGKFTLWEHPLAFLCWIAFFVGRRDATSDGKLPYCAASCHVWEQAAMLGTRLPRSKTGQCRLFFFKPSHYNRDWQMRVHCLQTKMSRNNLSLSGLPYCITGGHVEQDTISWLVMTKHEMYKENLIKLEESTKFP